MNHVVFSHKYTVNAYQDLPRATGLYYKTNINLHSNTFKPKHDIFSGDEVLLITNYTSISLNTCNNSVVENSRRMPSF